MNTIDQIFVPGIPPAQKHPTIMQKFDALKEGDAFLLINDHDPIPLYYELRAEKAGLFEWEKIEDGPEQWKVQITRKGRASDPVTTKEQGTRKEGEPLVIDVTRIEPRQKHPFIFRNFDELPPGGVLLLLNDHDPKPLYYQMLGERGPVFSWTYLEKGPQWWKVEIRKNEGPKEETVGEITAKDLRKAAVFKKYGIDFCCGGKKTLKEACEEKGVDLNLVKAALEQPQESPSSANTYDNWQLDFLADYIYNQHHLYYYRVMPEIRGLMSKVADHHGAAHPELQVLSALVDRLTGELDIHFMREEKLVFPFIKALVSARRSGNPAALQAQPSISEPLRVMESDHEAAGELLVEMRKATGDYTVPEDACNSYRYLYKKLEELEEDLHQHIHLENNILFPKALKMEKEGRA